MRLHDVLRDEKAVAGGVHVYFLRVFAVAAFGKEVFLVFLGDADARVFHRENDFPIIFFERNADGARRSVVDGVINQVAQHVVANLRFMPGLDKSEGIGSLDTYSPINLNVQCIINGTLCERNASPR